MNNKAAFDGLAAVRPVLSKAGTDHGITPQAEGTAFSDIGFRMHLEDIENIQVVDDDTARSSGLSIRPAE